MWESSKAWTFLRGMVNVQLSIKVAINKHRTYICGKLSCFHSSQTFNATKRTSAYLQSRQGEEKTPAPLKGGQYAMCSFCPWRYTRHVRSTFGLLHTCEHLSAPSSFLSRQEPRGGLDRTVTLWRIGQTWGSAQQTSHLCDCMGTSGPHRLKGPSVCLKCEPTHKAGVSGGCHGTSFFFFTPTQVLVGLQKQSLQYQNK